MFILKLQTIVKELVDLVQLRLHVIPYRFNVHLKAEENCQVSCGTCPTIAHSTSPTAFQSPSMSPLVSTSPPCFIPPSIPLTMSLTAFVDRLDQFLVPGSSGNDRSTCNCIIRNNVLLSNNSMEI